MNRFEPEAIQVEKARLAAEVRITKKKARIEEVRLVAEARQLQQQQQTKKARIEKVRLTEKARITKKKIEAFACRRCFEKYFSNIKLHEHVRTKHTKLEKPTPTMITMTTPSVLSTTSCVTTFTTSRKPIS